MKRTLPALVALVSMMAAGGLAVAQTPAKKPNILIIWGDDNGAEKFTWPDGGQSRRIEHLFVLVPAQEYVGKFLATFREFPPSQRPGSFGIDQALEALLSGAQGGSK